MANLAQIVEPGRVIAKLSIAKAINTACILIWFGAIFATMRLLLPDVPWDMIALYGALSMVSVFANKRLKPEPQSEECEEVASTPRFGLTSLFTAMTLMGLGISGLGTIYHVPANSFVPFVLFAASWVIITAGLTSLIPIRVHGEIVGKGHGFMKAFASPYGLIVACAMIFSLILLQSAI